MSQHVTVMLEDLHQSEDKRQAEVVQDRARWRQHENCRVSDTVVVSWQCLRHARHIIECLNTRVIEESHVMQEDLPRLRALAAMRPLILVFLLAVIPVA